MPHQPVGVLVLPVPEVDHLTRVSTRHEVLALPLAPRSREAHVVRVPLAHLPALRTRGRQHPATGHRLDVHRRDLLVPDLDPQPRVRRLRPGAHAGRRDTVHPGRGSRQPRPAGLGLHEVVHGTRTLPRTGGVIPTEDDERTRVSRLLPLRRDHEDGVREGVVPVAGLGLRDPALVAGLGLLQQRTGLHGGDPGAVRRGLGDRVDERVVVEDLLGLLLADHPRHDGSSRSGCRPRRRRPRLGTGLPLPARTPRAPRRHDNGDPEPGTPLPPRPRNPTPHDRSPHNPDHQNAADHITPANAPSQHPASKRHVTPHHAFE